MDEWKKLNETLPGNEEFYGNLNMEDFTNADVRKDAKNVRKDFEIKMLRE